MLTGWCAFPGAWSPVFVLGSDSLAATLTPVPLLPSPGSQITEGVKPTLSELEKFEDQPEGIDLEVVTEGTGIWSWPHPWLWRRVALETAVRSALHCSLREGAGTQFPARGQCGGVRG